MSQIDLSKVKPYSRRGRTLGDEVESMVTKFGDQQFMCSHIIALLHSSNDPFIKNKSYDAYKSATRHTVRKMIKAGQVKVIKEPTVKNDPGVYQYVGGDS